MGLNQRYMFTQIHKIWFEDICRRKSNSILYAGRISNEKGVDKLIESFQNAQLGDINLNIVGDGPLLKN